ncbi:MAG: helix-turn-helix transcriptional regulator, partial [Clostridia bacterium]|nr:helix-turn-helix transcriptional regulator [Clostridia bacterium]
TERDFKIEELHGVAGINPKHYRNLFIKKFGVSPKEYVTLLRLKMAEELLLGEKYSITQIALLLGFCDVYHFSKVFKEKKGISPSEYKNNKIK